MKHRHQVEKLEKFLAFVLGRQPDEFGLVPDDKGYVKTKDLLRALSEEDGWRHVRLGHLREITCSCLSPQIEIAGSLVRAVDRSRLGTPELCQDAPKLLYYPIRRRAYPVVLEKGLPSGPGSNQIALAMDKAFAERLGRRIDPDPIILTVHSPKAQTLGATLWRFGQQIYLADQLPMGSFSGPPLPKQPAEPQKKSRNAPETPTAPHTPGSYFLDLMIPDGGENPTKKNPRKRKNEWKRERKLKNRRGGF